MFEINCTSKSLTNDFYYKVFTLYNKKQQICFKTTVLLFVHINNSNKYHKKVVKLLHIFCFLLI